MPSTGAATLPGVAAHQTGNGPPIGKGYGREVNWSYRPNSSIPRKELELNNPALISPARIIAAWWPRSRHVGERSEPVANSGQIWPIEQLTESVIELHHPSIQHFLNIAEGNDNESSEDIQTYPEMPQRGGGLDPQGVPEMSPEAIAAKMKEHMGLK